MSRFLAATLAIGITYPAGAQDPTKTRPNSYKVEFENDYVRIVRVHYDAGARLAEHTHPAGTTVYVYLNDSEGVVFKHVGGSNSTVTRPAVKAGAMRVATGREEHHTAENTSSTPSDFLRIFFKTEDTSGSRNLRQRLSPTDKEWSNTQLRITRLRLEQHDSVSIDTKGAPALLIEWPSGANRWVDAGRSTPLEHHDAPDLNVIRIDFLTAPKPEA
jgi:hypothetical protein